MTVGEIVSLLEARGINLKKKTAGEMAGPCPFCGGTDRFCVWPEENRFWCRGCNRKGDTIQLLRDLDGLSFEEATEAVGKPTTATPRKTAKSGKPTRQPFVHPELGKPDHGYSYANVKGELVFCVCRWDATTTRKKEIRQCLPDGLTWSLKGVPLCLYNQPDIAKYPTMPVWFVEGEKCADLLTSIDIKPATTAPLGAGKWPRLQSEYNIGEPLTGRTVYILPDNDAPGRKHADDIAQSLHGKAKEIKIVELPGLPEKGDVCDFLEEHGADGTFKTLLELANETPVYTPQENEISISGKKDIAAMVREYLLEEFDGGVFRISDLKRELGLSDADYTLARQCVRRMAAHQGLVEKHGQSLGTYRVVSKKKSQISWDEVQAKPSSLLLPGGLNEIVTTREGDLIAFAGFKNMSKTAIATEIVRLNLDTFQVHFFITEYKSRMKQRLLDFGVRLDHPNLHCYQIEKSDYIPDKIESGEGVLNVIDHMPNLDNFYLVGKVQDEIHRGLNGALCVITHQKLNHPRL
ncbi:putative Predicted DNA-binding protein [uncultured Desulfobacterium sp.]|uniref:Putative Predicted DNA-binding protein n=1 Tax=uncultured Desulfobacterium sp. TaxID=201089 RepID=A0A445MSS5_9BACT|nr:putative Predicted DNA-binding protein [uncultured Desulfobacterium sp.]